VAGALALMPPPEAGVVAPAVEMAAESGPLDPLHADTEATIASDNVAAAKCRRGKDFRAVRAGTKLLGEAWSGV
jgi:hypothetical protein